MYEICDLELTNDIYITTDLYTLIFLDFPLAILGFTIVMALYNIVELYPCMLLDLFSKCPFLPFSRFLLFFDLHKQVGITETGRVVELFGAGTAHAIKIEYLGSGAVIPTRWHQEMRGW